MSLTKTLALLDDKTRIVTPQFEPWLEAHGDEPYPQWVVDIIAELMSRAPRNRLGTFSASSAGTCLRAQELEFMGAHPTMEQMVPAGLMAIYQDGKWRHLRWQAQLLTAGILSRIEVPMPWRNARSMATLDGAGLVPEDHPNRKWRKLDYGFELKGVSPYWYPKWTKAPQAQEKHLRQVHRYFVSTGFELFVIIYENKGSQEWHEWVIRPDPRLMRESEQELKHLNRAVDERRLHAMLRSCQKHIGADWKGCPYAGVGGTCEKAKGWLNPKAETREARPAEVPRSRGTPGDVIAHV